MYPDVTEANGDTYAYSVCYCDAQSDEHERQDEDSHYYKWHDNKKYESSGEMGLGSMFADIQADSCNTKCDRGCVGADCNCDDYESGLSASTLCLTEAQCRSACDDLQTTNPDFVGGSNAVCTGYQMKRDTTLCTLVTQADAPFEARSDEHYYSFRRIEAAAVCTDPSDYDEVAGTLYVTRRVEIGLDYVFEPHTPVGIEVTSVNDRALTYLAGSNQHDTGLSRDRIMVIDCKGTCGVTPPPGDGVIHMVDGNMDLSMASSWNWVFARNWFFDPASDQVATEDIPTDPLVKDAAYGMHANRYCSNNNIEINKHSILDVTTMTYKTIGELAGCYHICHDLEGDAAPCQTGFMVGHDTASSNAVCGTEQELLNLCNMVRFECDRMGAECSVDCDSVDIHKTKDRGFLNTGCIEEITSYGIEAQPTSSEYNLYVWDGVTPEEVVGGGSVAFAAQRDKILTAVDWDWSWQDLLRFPQISFSNGGTYKLCFCDSEHHDGYCAGLSDYTVEVGKIHVSGVGCLMDDAKYRRHACVEQRWGGLRCYLDDQVPLVGAPLVSASSGVSEIISLASSEEEFSYFCGFGPEEPIGRSPACQLVSQYQSLYGNY